MTLTLEAMGNATLPITIDPDTSFTTTDSDGYIEGWDGSPSYNSIWTNSSGTVYDSRGSFWMGQAYASSGNYYCIFRGFVFFNTASLPSDANITSATLSLYEWVDNSKTDFDIVVQSGMPTCPHDRLVGVDYEKGNYSGDGGSFNTVNLIPSDYNNITLNADGRSWINKDGWTKFALRSQEDISGSAPSENECISVFSYEYGAGYRPELVVTYEILPLLERYAPVLYFHPEEDYYTDSIDSMLNESDLMILLNDNETRKDILPGPVSQSQLPGPNSTGKYYLDMWNATGAPLFSNDTAELPDPSRFTDYPYTVYGRQVEKSYQGDDYIVLQYWFFYPYNNWWNCHEGDWERIQIICDKDTETPINVTFGQHWGGETVTRDSINNSLVAETHPKVFPASGSHASYPNNGDNGEHLLMRLGNQDLIDYTSYAGKALYPGYVSVYEIPGVDRLPYTLTAISGEPSWVKWSGIWGFYVPGAWGGFGQSGPPSPANLSVNGINVWDDPIEWANNPGSSSIVGTATGPVIGSVRLHAYDSNGNHTGLNETGWIETQIPGTYFYVPASNQSEAELMWIYTEENLTFIIEASEVGECNFSFARCVGGEITTNYTHVEVIENTTATLATGAANPMLIMEIDFDGDGVTDKCKFPDSDNTLKGQVNFAGRDTPPNDRWIEPFMVKLFEPGNLSNVLWTGVATTNNTGVFTIDDIPAGTYDIGIKNCTCLSKLVTNVTVDVNETIEVDFGTTREGDANNDDYVNILDSSALSSAFGSSEGDPNWNPHCDFNRDGNINILDASILSSNYGQHGDLR